MTTKLFIIAGLLCGCAALAGIGHYAWSHRTESSATAADGAPAPERVLVAYYSYSGNTKAVAERIAQATGGKLIEITAVNPYPEDYQACVDQAKAEIRKGATPAINHEVIDWDAYDLVFVGSPNWWSTIAPPVRTFLSNPKMADKQVALFITHGGGGEAHTTRDTRALLPKTSFLGTLALPGDEAASSDAEIDAWVKSILPKH